MPKWTKKKEYISQNKEREKTQTKVRANNQKIDNYYT